MVNLSFIILEKNGKVRRDEVSWIGRKLPLSLGIISGLRYEFDYLNEMK